jgi:hypothetical protein
MAYRVFLKKRRSPDSSYNVGNETGMSRKKITREKPQQQDLQVPETGIARIESYRFGEATVRVCEVDVNTWQCSMDEGVIGFVTYTPEYKFKIDGRGRDYGYRAFHSHTREGAEEHPATEVNTYSSLRNATRAVVAHHYSGRRYTYVHDNIVILDGQVVPESVFRGRKIIKPLLENTRK